MLQLTGVFWISYFRRVHCRELRIKLTVLQSRVGKYGPCGAGRQEVCVFHAEADCGTACACVCARVCAWRSAGSSPACLRGRCSPMCLGVHVSTSLGP